MEYMEYSEQEHKVLDLLDEAMAEFRKLPDIRFKEDEQFREYIIQCQTLVILQTARRHKDAGIWSEK